MVRLKGLKFSRTQGGPQNRTLRATATGPAAAARATGVGGLSFLCEDLHNEVLAACDPNDSHEQDGARLEAAAAAMRAEEAATVAEAEAEARAADALEAQA